MLRTAIETTEDSLSLADGDLNKRTRDVLAQQEREKKAARASMTPEAKKAAEKADFDQQNSKAPTLYRPGEKKPTKRSRTTGKGQGSAAPPR